MQRLFEMLEEHCTLIFGVTAGHNSLDLYYWKFDAVEVGKLSRISALNRIDTVLRKLGYENPLKKVIAEEIFRLTAAIQGPFRELLLLSAISRACSMMQSESGAYSWMVELAWIAGCKAEFIRGRS